MAKLAGRMEAKQRATREHLLDTAERLLLQSSPPDFSMRQLCQEAGLSFATPFNYFGSKNGIIRGLALRIFDRIEAGYEAMPEAGDALARLDRMNAAGVHLWLEEPAVYRFISASLLTVEGGEGSEEFLARSSALWRRALGDAEGLLRSDCKALALEILPLHIAIGFRGMMALWIGGEIADRDIEPLMRAQISALVLGFAEPHRQRELLERCRATTGAGRVYEVV
ncbi:MAG: TetR/AcrR family transcriptional regulator [Rhizobium sp.]|nr:TetR/AcrR family transcriptional regulator [Rhizobium sp.]